MLYEHNRMLVDQLIKTQKKSLSSYVIYTFVVLIFGAFLYMSGRLISNESLLNAINITSSFVSSLSGLSIKEIIDKKRTLELVQGIKSTVDRNQDNQPEQEVIRTTLQTLITVML